MRKLFYITSLWLLFMGLALLPAVPACAGSQALQSAAPGYKGDPLAPIWKLWGEQRKPVMKFSALPASREAALRKFLNEIMPPNMHTEVCGDCTCECGKKKCECLPNCEAIVDMVDCCDGKCECKKCCCSDPGW